MLIDLKPLVGTPQVNELLAYAVIDDPDALVRTSEEYSKLAAMQLCGWEEDGLLVGLTGYEETEDGSLDIRHIAVLPENRGKGYARGMILELVTSRQPRYLVAETEDEIAADFTAVWASWCTAWARTLPASKCSAVSMRWKRRRTRSKRPGRYREMQ